LKHGGDVKQGEYARVGMKKSLAKVPYPLNDLIHRGGIRQLHFHPPLLWHPLRGAGVVAPVHLDRHFGRPRWGPGERAVWPVGGDGGVRDERAAHELAQPTGAARRRRMIMVVREGLGKGKASEQAGEYFTCR